MLTAAHNWDAGAVTHLSFSINDQHHEAESWIQHPGWDGTFSPQQGWNIGLVRLAQPVTGFGATRIYAGNTEHDLTITILGTGLTRTSGGVSDLNSPLGPGGLLVYDFDNATQPATASPSQPPTTPPEHRSPQTAASPAAEAPPS